MFTRATYARHNLKKESSFVGRKKASKFVGRVCSRTAIKGFHAPELTHASYYTKVVLLQVARQS
jgi:hypothetical protein